MIYLDVESNDLPGAEETVMKLARIQNLNRPMSAAAREAFESTVFSTPTGSARLDVLRWGDEIEILEWRDRRSRVRAEGGLEGWVAKGDVVELRWIRKSGSRYTAPLFQNATGSEKWFDLLWGDPVLVMTPSTPRSRVWARNWTG
jgi:hypothetical protein